MLTEIIAHPLLVAGIAVLFANLFVAGVAYGLSGAAPRHAARLGAWCHRTFTRAGDGCIDCNRFTVTADCQTCGTVRTFTPSGIVTSRASRPPAPATITDFTAERRRLEALAMIGPHASRKVM